MMCRQHCDGDKAERLLQQGRKGNAATEDDDDGFDEGRHDGHAEDHDRETHSFTAFVLVYVLACVQSVL